MTNENPVCSNCQSELYTEEEIANKLCEDCKGVEENE